MQYENFDLEIGELVDGGYILSARSSEGDRRASLKLPFEEAMLNELLLKVELEVSRGARVARRMEGGEAVTSAFGGKLFDALFLPGIRSLFDRTLTAAAARQQRGVRLSLRIVRPELAALPWEFLFDAEQARFLCLNPTTPVVRYVEIARPRQPLAAQPPLRVLGLAASPAALAHLNVDQEKQRVQEALADLVAGQKIEIVWLARSNWRELQRMLRREPWHILHFIGHGGFDPNRGEGVLMLDGDQPGEAYRLRASSLADMLDAHPTLRFVMLNSCEGARAARDDLFSSTAATLVRRGVPAVLAMQYEVSDRAAIEFSQEFYRALADGVPVDAAVTEARRAVSLALPESVEWGTPVLFTHALDGSLFRWEADQRLSTAAPAAVPALTAGVAPADCADEVTRDLVPHPAMSPRPAAPAQVTAATVARPAETQPEIDWHAPDVPVLLLAAVRDYELRDRVRKALKGPLGRPQPVWESNQSFCFTWQDVDPAVLNDVVARFLANNQQGAAQLAVVLSDSLLDRDLSPGGQLSPSNLAQSIRRQAVEQTKLCGLVALAPSERRRASDIDRIVDWRKLSEPVLLDAVLHVADGLRLKAPPGPTVELKEGEAIRVRIVRDEPDMKSSLELRFDVYERLGYLEDLVANGPSRMELDCYDRKAIHFLAEHIFADPHEAHELVGTLRLVLARPLRETYGLTAIGPQPRLTMEKQAQLCVAIADDEAKRWPGNAVLKEKLRASNFASLPILQSVDFKQKAGEILKQGPALAEVSRVVVRPRYRGLAISRLIVRAALAVASTLNRNLLLLECVPAHAKMYAKHGFERIEGYHGRAQDLDQIAVAMKLHLPEVSQSRLSGQIRRYVKMMFSCRSDSNSLIGNQHLCLCRNRGCWSEGAYDYATHASCPLRTFHGTDLPVPHPG